MANAIASDTMVIAMGKAGFLGSFGSAGLVPSKVEAAIQKVQSSLPGKPYAFNLINSPNEPAMERNTCELFVKYHVPVIEASAYMEITYPLAYYRLSGLSVDEQGKIVIGHRMIAKVSRKEVARRFLEPAPADLIRQLLAENKINELQARLAEQVPMADDITVEADSGGHTDNRPLVGLIPSMLALRDEIQTQRQYAQPVRIGAAGGIGTPGAAAAAFAMGAAYIVTGSINQSCIEAGSSQHTRNLLAQAGMADVAMAPAADMFEMGVRVQVLKRGTMFAMRASHLYEIYSRYNSIDDIPLPEREKLEKTIFKRNLDSVWEETVRFFTERDPRQIERAEKDPRQKMALVFRWYLGLSSRWSNTGEPGREMDYQIWCGPAMGTFNDWARGTYLESPENRQIVDVSMHLLTGAAYLLRLRMLTLQGIQLPASLEQYYPAKPLA
jgi:PfaD family protein